MAQEHEPPANFIEGKKSSLLRKKAQLMGALSEIDLELQRLDMGRQPSSLVEIFETIDLSPLPAKVMTRRMEQSPKLNQLQIQQQAGQQSDAVAMTRPPYESLLQ